MLRAETRGSASASVLDNLTEDGLVTKSSYAYLNLANISRNRDDGQVRREGRTWNGTCASWRKESGWPFYSRVVWMRT